MNNFPQKKAEGGAAEAHVAEYLRQWYEVRPATDEEQSRGIDLVVSDQHGTTYTFEVKADSRAADTGNAFVETTSMELYPISCGFKAAALDRARPGWAKTTQADAIIYWVPGLGKAWVLLPEDLRAALPDWERDCRERSVDNEFYRTIGRLVPLKEFDRIATEVLSLPPPRTGE